MEQVGRGVLLSQPLVDVQRVSVAGNRQTTGQDCLEDVAVSNVFLERGDAAQEFLVGDVELCGAGSTGAGGCGAGEAGVGVAAVGASTGPTLSTTVSRRSQPARSTPNAIQIRMGLGTLNTRHTGHRLVYDHAERNRTPGCPPRMN